MNGTHGLYACVVLNDANYDEVVAGLRMQRVLPILRCQTPEEAIETAAVLRDAGVPMVELTTSIPDVTQAVREIAAAGSLVGVGTIRDAAQVPEMVAAGAGFVVSYFRPAGFLAAAHEAGVAAIPGAITPTEIQVAASEGARIVKLFPAWQVGPRLLGDLAPLVLGMEYIATGGITLATAKEWMSAGIAALGLGRGLGSVVTDGPDHVRSRLQEWQDATNRRHA